jgi:hypothetical protein
VIAAAPHGRGTRPSGRVAKPKRGEIEARVLHLRWGVRARHVRPTIARQQSASPEPRLNRRGAPAPGRGQRRLFLQFGANAPCNEIKGLGLPRCYGLGVRKRGPLPSFRGSSHGAAFFVVGGSANLLAGGSVPAVGGDHVQNILPDTLAGDCRCGVACRRYLSPLSEIMPERCTPEFERMLARIGSLGAYGRVPALIAEFLPLGRLVAPETARRRTLRVGARLERLSLTAEPGAGSVDDTVRRWRARQIDQELPCEIVRDPGGSSEKRQKPRFIRSGQAASLRSD